LSVRTKWTYLDGREEIVAWRLAPWRACNVRCAASRAPRRAAAAILSTVTRVCELFDAKARRFSQTPNQFHGLYFPFLLCSAEVQPYFVAECYRWVPVISAKNHKRQRRKRQSVTAKREKSQTPKVLNAILTLPNLT